jgi:hypothetical protein
MERELPPVRWVVPGILPEGVTLLAGKAKIRKSWLAMGLCVAVASGGVAFGTVRVERGAALYLALEDNERRLQSRLGKILDGDLAPEGFDYATECPRVDEGGLEAIEGWLEEHPEARLVIIDTLAKFRPRTNGNNGYQEDYEALEPLLPLAAKYQVAIVVIAHLRKAAAADPIDEVNSTSGLTGGVDGIITLKTERGKAEATMFVTGREIEEEGDLALRWDQSIHGWTLIGSADEHRLTEERRLILDILRAAGGPMQFSEIVKQAGKNKNAVTNLLSKLLLDDRVERAGRGRWQLATHEQSTPPPLADVLGGVLETPHGNAENSQKYTSILSTPVYTPPAPEPDPSVHGVLGVLSDETPHGNAQNCSQESTPPSTSAKGGGVQASTAGEGLGDWRNHPLDCECEGCLYGD